MSRQMNIDIAVDNRVDRGRSPSHKLLTATDITVYGLILSLAALQLALSQRADDFFTGDTIYFELARSIISEGFYGFNFKPETLLPPGFPLILASLCVTLGCTYAVLIRSIAVFATLGFIASYELLRREEGRTVAAVVCLLLASSPIVFAFSTRMVFSDLPYFFTSISTLLLATRLDRANSSRARVSLWLLCGCLLAGSLLIRSSGIALLMGLFGWLVVSRFAEREVRLKRLRTFVPLLLAGLLVEILWMQWAARNEVLQWPMVGGYPQPYFAQLSMKSGNYPELGAASLSDILPRVAENLADRAVALFVLLTRKDYINPAWFSPAVFSVVLLILLGVGTSIWHGGGDWPVWYFISHEAVYLLWPWDFEMRFFLPVAPLACLYLWRGGKALLGVASRKPRVVGAWSLPLSVLLGVYAGASGWNSGSLQPILAALFWASVAAVSALIVWGHSYQMPVAIGSFLMPLRIVGQKSLRVLPIVGAVAVAILVGTGIARQVSIGRDNLAFDLTKQPSYPDIVGAKWIQDHTTSAAVVMARQVDVVYHYSRHKVVWFPPSSDAQHLMEGIRKYKVEFVIVNDRQNSYWLPPEHECFGSLSRAYPKAFQVVHQELGLRIYKIITDFA
jgi:Dolichyl-phosphate-mannose-protein mannosyltransferase